MMQGERLQKVLAGWGLGSRRAIEAWIAAGEVTVNGEVATLGTRVLPTDRIEVRGQPVRIRAETFTRRVLIYHKPEGELTTRSDPQGRPTVFERLPPIRDGRWITVGRLDFNTSGLLIVTNDGELANRMMHPSREVLRVYAVRIFGELTAVMRKQLLDGVQLEDGLARFESIVDAGGTGMNHWYHVSLREGRNREVRRMFEAVGLTVSRLIRIQYGDLTLPPRLKPGKWKMLSPEEVDALAMSLGMEAKPGAPTLPVRGPRRSPGGGSGQPAARKVMVRPAGKGRKVYVVREGKAVCDESASALECKPRGDTSRERSECRGERGRKRSGGTLGGRAVRKRV
ncbi:MAG: 23S rRNA pseudouridine(2605) synthase RluB [Halothiobacillaceae bacterium]